VASDLTPKQEAFALAYVETGNATEAYRRAGYSPNMSDKTATEAASRLLKNSNVIARVDELRQKVAERHNVTVDKIVRELAALGFSNMLDYIRTTSDGDAYVDLSALTREQAAAISEIVVEEYKEGKGDDARDVKRTRFKLTDKRAALVDLGKHLGMFKEVKEVTGKNGAPIQAEVTHKLDDASLAKLSGLLE
jgi:phage terminase small subunit